MPDKKSLRRPEDESAKSKYPDMISLPDITAVAGYVKVNKKYIHKEIRKMRMKFSKKFLSCILSMMLIVAMAFATGCGNKGGGNDTAGTGNVTGTETGADTSTDTSTDADTDASADKSDDASADVDTGVTVLGEGATTFNVTVTDKDGNETQFEIHTDKETVGAALLELELIAGEEGAYGLYIKQVNGITADYDVDQTYWAFYIDGEYAMSGADTTTITEGSTYSFKVEK